MLKIDDKPKYLVLPRISNAEVQLLWDVEYYDRPLEGVAEWNGRKYWFTSIQEEVPDQKEFFLIKLPESEMKKVEDIQQLRESIYDASNRHDEGRSNRWKWDELKGDSWSAAYKESQGSFESFVMASSRLAQPDFDRGEVIGWCLWKEPETEPAAPSHGDKPAN